MSRLDLLRRLLFLFALVVMSFFTVRSILGERGLLEVSRQQSELEQLRVEVEVARVRNAALAAEIEQLRTGRAGIERLARERLGYIRPGEVTYLFTEESSDPPPPVSARN